jgi:regulatory protein
MIIKNNASNAPEIFDKAVRYCNVEERCRSQVAAKLRQWDVVSSMADGILIGLENAGFLNEDRYAELFVRSKVRQNNWGRYKIVHALKAANVNSESIEHGLLLLEEQTYCDALENVIRKAQKTICETNPALKQRKIIQHAVSKGFEADLILDILHNEKLNNNTDE